jgi:hypothetical protein
LLVLNEISAAGPDRVDIGINLIPGPAELRVETAGICRWRVSVIRADAKAAPHYALIRHDGSVAFRNSFWADGVVQATIMDMAPLDSGGAVVSGGMIQADGAIARGAMIVRPDGTMEHFIRTDDYIPHQVAAGQDDSVWVFGRQRGDEAGIARKYSLDGEFQGEFLPRSMFGSEVHPSMPGGRAGRSFARRLGEGVGFYSGVTGEWVELDANGELVRRVPLPLVQVQLLAVTNSGRVLAWISGQRFGIYELAPGAESWAAIPGWVGSIDAPPSVGLLHGARGELIALQELPALLNLHFSSVPRSGQSDHLFPHDSPARK